MSLNANPIDAELFCNDTVYSMRMAIWKISPNFVGRRSFTIGVATIGNNRGKTGKSSTV